MDEESTFKPGQTVRVKTDYRDEATGLPLADFHGRIVELNPETRILRIAFDSLTLRSLPVGYVEMCEAEGFDWASYYIGYDDVEAAAARDTEADVKTAVAELAAQAGWAYLGAEGRAINQVVGGIHHDDDLALMVAWRTYKPVYLYALWYANR
jgi:hypothetical protein